MPTPITSGIADVSVVVDAAVKIAAHDTIVAGFDAVAPSEVRKRTPWRGDVGRNLETGANPHGRHQALVTEPDEHCGAEQAERHPQRIEGEH